MTLVKPFRALRPRPEVAKQVSCVPYDVVYDPEVREHISINPMSFLQVTRAEATFARSEGHSPEQVFERARYNLDKFVRENIYTVDSEDAYYIYQLHSPTHQQTGFVGCCSLDEYESGLIKKHEKVRPDKVEDRTGHLLTVKAQTGLIFLAFRGTQRVHDLFDQVLSSEPLYQFTCQDQIQHTIWRVTETGPWTDAFAEVPALYIADGHHRAESALRAREERKKSDPNHTGDEDYNCVVAGMFPAEDLKILAYNRVIRGWNGLTEAEFFEALRENFIVSETEDKEPKQHGEICMYTGRKWYKLAFNVKFVREPDPIERLDVSILQHYILEPALGIEDARTDRRIGFVSGKRGTAEIEKIVDRGSAVIGFSLFPTTMDDLFAVSDMGEIMPPKSTWFEPKLKDGLLVHLI